MQMFRSWLNRHFNNPQLAILIVIVLLGFLVVYFLGKILLPLFMALIIAYLLDGMIKPLVQRNVPRILALAGVFIVFMLLLVFTMFWLAPLLVKQVTQLVQQLPSMIASGQDLLLQLPEKYPKLVTENQMYELSAAIRREVTGMAQHLLSISVASVVGLITILVYLVIVPMLLFFFLKDKDKIIEWFSSFLPTDRTLATQVWEDVNMQIGNYVRGKIWEIIIVWSGTFIVFTFLKLQYAMLLGFVVGLSVLFPYVGAAVATLPIAAVAYFQWGWGAEFAWILVAYAIIQVIDGNILVPLLLSEVVNLHPVGVITSIFLFGGLWGFWGIFFAIPLATLIQAIIKVWPRAQPQTLPTEDMPPDVL